MAVFTLQLDDITGNDGKVQLHLIANGAKVLMEFEHKAALIEWSKSGEKLTLDDLVRHAVRKAIQTDPTLSNPAHFKGKTLTVEVITGVA